MWKLCAVVLRLTLICKQKHKPPTYIDKQKSMIAKGSFEYFIYCLDRSSFGFVYKNTTQVKKYE